MDFVEGDKSLEEILLMSKALCKCEIDSFVLM